MRAGDMGSDTSFPAASESRVPTTPWNGGELDQLLCPECCGEYVYPALGATHYECTDDHTCPLGTRGSWLAIPFECENCDTEWRLIVGIHKGHTVIGMKVR
jgi:hypothetical protein